MQYNEAQLKVIYSQQPNIVVTAPPGSGKTHNIVGVIHEYLSQHPTHSVTAITFTRKGAAELERRIGDKRVQTGTIHSWSLKRLYDYGRKYGFQVELLEEEEIKQILSKIAAQRRMKYVNIVQLYLYITGAIPTLDLDETIVKRYEMIKATYIQFKADRGLYDFTDLPQYLLDVMEEYDERIYDIDALFVDEFQDIDEVQFKIFNRVDAVKKVYIGDAHQAIYQFRGAIEHIFDILAEDNFHAMHLDTNYRSKQNIINAADSLRMAALETLEDGSDCYLCDLMITDQSETICARGEGGNVYQVPDINTCYSAKYNEEQFYNPQQLIKSLFSEEGTMVLCRSNKQVRKLQALGITEVSTIHQAKGLEYNNVIMMDIDVSSEEELNVAYVAMTRAKNNLCIINFDAFVAVVAALPNGAKMQSNAPKLLF